MTHSHARFILIIFVLPPLNELGDLHQFDAVTLGHSR